MNKDEYNLLIQSGYDFRLIVPARRYKKWQSNIHLQLINSIELAFSDMMTPNISVTVNDRQIIIPCGHLSLFEMVDLSQMIRNSIFYDRREFGHIGTEISRDGIFWHSPLRALTYVEVLENL